MTDESSLGLYDRLLAAIGERAAEVGTVVTHWPHVGSAYRGLVIVGQALHGWPDDFPADQFRTRDGRRRAIEVTLARSSNSDEPLAWLERHRVRNSPFWRTVRLVSEALEPEAAVPWYGRLAWVNLYPVAPADPPGNPGGALREAQDPVVADLLQATMHMLKARIVIALVGPYWWPTGTATPFAQLSVQSRPLLRSGQLDERTWVVGWHPGGASRRGWGPAAYADLLAGEVNRVRDLPGVTGLRH